MSDAKVNGLAKASSDGSSDVSNPPQKAQPSSEEELDKALDSFANFKVWESKQAWKPDYDREANIANSRNRAKAAIQTLYIPRQEAAAERERAVVEFARNIKDKVKLELEAGGRYPGHLIEPWADVVRPIIYAKADQPQKEKP